MPYGFEIHKLNLPKKLDRRRSKLTDENRMKIKENIHGLSQRELAKEYGVSRSLIQMILNPERAERVRRLSAERRKDGRYYNKEKHRIAIKKTRAWKKLHKNVLQKNDGGV